MPLRSWFAGSFGDGVSRASGPDQSRTVQLVCVRHYQETVAHRAAGDRVYLVREHGNPYDPAAIVVVDTERATLGLIGRDSWLHRPLLQEGQGCSAWIEMVTRGASGQLGVVIRVKLGGPPIGMRAHRQAAARSLHPKHMQAS